MVALGDSLVKPIIKELKGIYFVTSKLIRIIFMVEGVPGQANLEAIYSGFF